MSLPKEGTAAWDKEVEAYLKSDKQWREKRAKQLGYKSRHIYQSRMSQCGILISGTDCPPITEPPEHSVTKTVTQNTNGLSPEEQQILQIINTSSVPVSVSELSRQLDRSSETIIRFIDSLRVKSYEVMIDEDTHSVTVPEILTADFHPTEFNYFRKYYKIGVVSDAHFCSKYQQVTLLHDAYCIFDREKTDFNVNAGDTFDGRDMYQGHVDELFKHGADDQLQYAIDNYPKSDRGTKTYVIGGNHDHSFFKKSGYNIVKALSKERKDLVYRGFFSALFKVKGMYVSLQHPSGGVAYARSYKIQKILEGMAGEMMEISRTYPARISELPVAVLFGHWHVKAQLPGYMGIDGISLPCFQSQTPYLKQKGLSPNVGCAILEVWLNDDHGVGAVRCKFVNMQGQVKKKDY